MCFEHTSFHYHPIICFIFQLAALWNLGSRKSFILPDLVIPYDESVLGVSSPSPPVMSPPISYREDRHLLKRNKIWYPAPNSKSKKKDWRRSPTLPPAPSRRYDIDSLFICYHTKFCSSQFFVSLNIKLSSTVRSNVIAFLHLSFLRGRARRNKGLGQNSSEK